MKKSRSSELRDGEVLCGQGKSTVSSQGQVTIPKVIRDRYGFSVGVEVEFELRENGALIRRRRTQRHPIWDMIGAGRAHWPPEFPDTVDAYIDWVRGGPYERPKSISRKRTARKR